MADVAQRRRGEAEVSFRFLPHAFRSPVSERLSPHLFGTSERIVARRLDEWEHNMRATLEGIKQRTERNE